MAHGDPPTSPWTYYDTADSTGKRMSVVFTFDATNTLTGATVHRDAGCQWTKVYIGLGSDGTPQSSTQVIDVSSLTGDRLVTSAQLGAVGLHTVADVLAISNFTVA